MQEQHTRRVTQAAVIAAGYTALTLLASALGVAFPAFQLRFSEALTVLPALTPAAIPGLTLGCLLSNILLSPMGVIDWVCGTIATLLAALLTRTLRHVRWRSVAWLAPLPPVLINALVIGAVLSFCMPTGFTWAAFGLSALSVGGGQFVACYGLGLPLLVALTKSKAMKRLLG